MNLMDTLASQPLVYLSTTLLLGLVVGSFLNVVVHRLPIMLERQWHEEAREVLELPTQPAERYDLFLPASHCPHCQHRIRAWENVPLLSYLFYGALLAVEPLSVVVTRWLNWGARP